MGESPAQHRRGRLPVTLGLDISVRRLALPTLVAASI